MWPAPGIDARAGGKAWFANVPFGLQCVGRITCNAFPPVPLLRAGTALALPALAQAPQRTQVEQSCQRAVIEWRGFDIGANHHVDIRQPDAAA